MSKKSYRLLASLLLMLVATLTSCEKFSIDETTGKSREANANVTIHAQKIAKKRHDKQHIVDSLVDLYKHLIGK